MNKCRYCGSQNSVGFFKGRYPVYALLVSKEEKRTICSADTPRIISLTYHYCKDCGFIFSDISQDVQKLIDESYERFYHFVSRLASNVATSEADSFLEETETFFEKKDSVLEVGCSDGYVLYHLKEKGLKVLGIEPSEYGIKVARENDIDVINDFFPCAELKDRRFDMIMSRHVIEHVESPFHFLKDQIGMLNENGVVIFETPNADWHLSEGNEGAFYAQHRILFTKYFIVRLLGDLNVKYAGIRELDHRIIVFCSPYPLDGLMPLFRLNEKVDVSSESDLFSFQRKIDTEIVAPFKALLLQHAEDRSAIWGGGSFTGNLLAQMEDVHNVKYIIDSDPQKWNLEFVHADIPVVSPKILCDQNVDVLFLFSQYADEIIVQLHKEGFMSRVCYVYRFFPKLELVAKC